MDKCPRCSGAVAFAGYEDARTFYQCEKCKRVWTTTVAAPPASTREPVRVLVADDSDLMVSLVASWLEDEGYDVMTATTGRQALDTAALQNPDVVLLDLIMPPPDGFEVCGKLRGLPQPPEIILMTGISDAGHLWRAMDLNPAKLLRKPLDAEAVVAAVAGVARRKYPNRIAPNSH
jgi:CheY-like chemotaxis protein